MPCISFIMPVYNNETYFPLAVQSILTQDETDFELIIVDDGSTDGTAKLADEMAARDSRIRVIHQKNQWIYASFNNGVKAARGEYIYIVNSDDKLRAGALFRMMRIVRQYHPDVVWTKVLAHICNREQEITQYDIDHMDRLVEKDSYYPDQQAVREAWPYFVSTVLAHNQANLYRRELLLRHPFRNDVYGADVLFNIAIARDVHSAFVLKEAVYDHFIYHQEGMNASVGKYYPYEHDMFHEIFLQYEALFEEWHISKEHYWNMIAERRLMQFAGELRALQLDKCPLTTEEKLKQMYLVCADGLIRRCAAALNRMEEMESRILSVTRALLLKEMIPEESEMYFLVGLLNGLLCYEKDEMDYRNIETALNHPLNPAQIGKSFYEKLKKPKTSKTGKAMAERV